MSKDEIKAELLRDPFVPLRMHLRNGKRISVPFREVAHILKDDILVLKGLKRGTHQAKGYLTFDFDDVVRIEQLRHGKGGERRRKAS
jgi:hypothetical protein